MASPELAPQTFPSNTATSEHTRNLACHDDADAADGADDDGPSGDTMADARPVASGGSRIDLQEAVALGRRGVHIRPAVGRGHGARRPEGL